MSKWVGALQTLFPRGLAWTRDPNSNLAKLLNGISGELERIEARRLRLIEEWDPNTAFESLSDYEALVGIPDDVQSAIATSIENRRRDILRKLTLLGGAYPKVFKDIATYLGYTISITDIRPSRCGRFRSGDRCFSTAWAYHFRVTVLNQNTSGFRSGHSFSGDRLGTNRNATLVAAINKAKPAHSRAVFQFGG